MTTEKTIVVHTEAPGIDIPQDKLLMVYDTEEKGYRLLFRAHVWNTLWGKVYTAWYDPQIGEVERVERYVVTQSRYYTGKLMVWLRGGGTRDSFVVADNIPTRSAAQRIADIYNEVAG